MEQSIKECEKIIIICDSLYAQKADNRIGGVGTEIDILSFNLENKKILPIVIKKNENLEIPTLILARKAMMVSNLQERYTEILNWCFDISKKSPLGKSPQETAINNKLVELSEEGAVGIFLLKKGSEKFLNFIFELSIEHQKKILLSLKETYSSDTGYGGT